MTYNFCFTLLSLPPRSPNNISPLIISVGLQEPNMITSKFEILRHALNKSPPSSAHNFSQSDSSTALHHIGTYDVHEQSEPKHSPDALSMVPRYWADVCKIVCQWMSPHIWHASFPNLLSVTVTSDPINCLLIILGHRGRIHLLGFTDDLLICDSRITLLSFSFLLLSSLPATTLVSFSTLPQTAYKHLTKWQTLKLKTDNSTLCAPYAY